MRVTSARENDAPFAPASVRPLPRACEPRSGGWHDQNIYDVHDQGAEADRGEAWSPSRFWFQTPLAERSRRIESLFVRTYSHAALTWAVARRLADRSGANVAAWGATGAVLPDLPAIAGAAWLGSWRRPLEQPGFRGEVCARRSFSGPDAALHSALPVGTLLLALWTRGSRRQKAYRPLLALLAGWVGHVLVDALTHAEDARPILWPVSERRFRSPISYWDRSHHARAFTMFEHGALVLLLATWAISRRAREPDPSAPRSG